jgi:2',3'-cyclic-nucleotide 2'-phosphodiesterase / 3'-nucleotidase
MTSRSPALLLPVALALLAACGDPMPAEGTKVEVAILSTTDLHANVLSYDYFKLAENKTFGLERTATLVAQARTEFANTVLVDDGDTIQGTVLGDWQAVVEPVSCDQRLAIHKVMNAMAYDVGNVGNHEFNYGLPFLSQVTNRDFHVEGLAAPSSCAGPAYPLVLSNVRSASGDAPIFEPYHLLDRTFTATAPDGSKRQVPLQIGVIGFTPPQIMTWDKRHLDGKIYATGIADAATQFVPEMRSAGADVVVALAHSGVDPVTPSSPTMENASWHLSQVPGIDAMVLGHSHDIFPNPGVASSVFSSMSNVDNTKGLINGVPAVMAASWGSRLGVIRLVLEYSSGAWHVLPDETRVESRSTRNADGTYVDADPALAPLVDAEHRATIDYVKTPIGSTDFRMATWFSLVGDQSALQVVNMAQQEYVKNAVQAGLPQYASLPVLSVTAPFKYGRGGATDYTDVAAGAMAIFNAADLYLFANTVYAVKVTGSDLDGWLEKSAQQFKQIDPSNTAPQDLIDTTFPGYNFDVLYGDITYEIDVTKAAGSRVTNLQYQGAPISPTQELIVATNNYRATGGGGFPGIDGSKTIIASPDTNRDVLIDYIKRNPTLTFAQHGSTRVWRFTQVTTAGPVVFRSGTNVLPVAQAHGLTGISLVSQNGDGTSTYAIDLSQ